LSDNLKWKTGLLSSSMPLELEAGRVLVSKGFAVNSDYKYARSDFEFINDLFIDLHAKSHTPFPDPDGEQSSDSVEITAQLELLVECRQRHPDAAWLFLPDPNERECSPASLGSTLRIVDKFSSYTIESDAAAVFDAELPICQKGLEIDLAKGDTDDSVFRQGISQLQYALPRLLTENVLFYIEDQPDENVPFLFCPIFLTNVQLFTLNKDATGQQIETASEFQEIATPAPCLIIHSDYSPGFKSQCMSEISRLKELQKSDKAMVIERKRARYYKSGFNLPFTIIESLNAGNRYYLDALFTQFIICTNSHFSMLVDTVKKIAESALETRKLIE